MSTYATRGPSSSLNAQATVDFPEPGGPQIHSTGIVTDGTYRPGRPVRSQ